MPKNRIHINEDALQRAIQPQIDKMQADLNEQLRSSIRGVRDEMEGQPADDVYAVLIQRLERDIPNLNVNEANMRTVAAEIEAGTLT